MDRRTEMLQLATELLSEHIRPVRILMFTDTNGEPQGVFASNNQRFTFRFTKSGDVTYQPQRGQPRKGQDVSDRGSDRDDSLVDRITRIKSMLRTA